MITKPDNFGGTLMKAIIFTKYGLDSLKLEDIQKPTPGDNEVLVEVHASSITVHNLGLVRGKPFFFTRYRWKKPDVERFSQAMHHQCS
jgi:NADPH:quinone reductase-like Zn-dependent oxidoreductase